MFILCSLCSCVYDLLTFHFFFHPDSEIEDIDNDSDDNKGCVCVILWTCSINVYSTISAATKTMTREAKQFNGFELQHIHHMDMELERSYVGLNILLSFTLVLPHQLSNQEYSKKILYTRWLKFYCKMSSYCLFRITVNLMDSRIILDVYGLVDAF